MKDFSKEIEQAATSNYGINNRMSPYEHQLKMCEQRAFKAACNSDIVKQMMEEEVCSVLEFIATQKIVLVESGHYYYEDDLDGECQLSPSELYQLFKNRNK